MSVIVIGLSHKSAPIDVLEATTLDAPRRADLLQQLTGSEALNEVLLLDTCNRVEVYADAETFHGAVTAISDALADSAGLPPARLRDHLYVHFSDRAVSHLFTVAAGLDSMAVGEGQILGQLRESLREGREDSRIGSTLDGLLQQALRVGKRVHAETDIDGVSRSLIERGLVQVAPHLGALEQQRVLVVGAGSMSSLAAQTISRAGARSVSILNRTFEAGERLASAVGGRARRWDELPAALAEADLVVSCTGAVGHVITADAVRAAGAAPRAFIDLALPRDVEPEVALLPDALLISLADLGAGVDGEQDHLYAARTLVTSEVEDYLTARRAAAVAPTVAMLRARAAEVVQTELERLQHRAPGLSEDDAAAVQLTVHRIVEKLLHTPTVRIKQLAGEGQDYTNALRELFDLDPRHAVAVSRPETEPKPDGQGGESR